MCLPLSYLVPACLQVGKFIANGEIHEAKLQGRQRPRAERQGRQPRQARLQGSKRRHAKRQGSQRRKAASGARQPAARAASGANCSHQQQPAQRREDSSGEASRVQPAARMVQPEARRKQLARDLPKVLWRGLLSLIRISLSRARCS